MLAPLLRTGLALQIVLGLWIGVEVAEALQLSRPWGAVGILFVVFAVQAGVTALSFGLAMPFRHAAEAGVRLGPRQVARLILREYLALTALYVLFQPFEKWFLRRPRPAVASGTPPVILVHGIYCNAASWWWMRRQLEALVPNPIHALDVEPPHGSIDDFARQLAQCIDRVVGETGTRQVVLVGHSMGGLVSRACLRLPGMEPRIAKLITIGSPHHGSRHARLGFGAAGRELRPDSAWMTRLNADPASTAVPVAAIYSRHDNFVAPQDNAILAGARMVPLDGIGHLTMLFSRRVAEAVAQEVRDGNALAGPDGSEMKSAQQLRERDLVG